MPCQFSAHKPHVKTTSTSTIQDHIHSANSLLTSWSHAELPIHCSQCLIIVHKWYPRKPYQSPSVLPNLYSCITIWGSSPERTGRFLDEMCRRWLAPPQHGNIVPASSWRKGRIMWRAGTWDWEEEKILLEQTLASASSSTPLWSETDMLFSIVGVNLTVYWSCAAVRDSELWVCLIMTGTRIKGLHRRARVAWNGIYFISSMLSHHQSCAYPDPPCVRWAAPSASGDTIGDGIA